MKKSLLFILSILFCVSLMDAQMKVKKSITKAQEDANPYRTVSIRDIQYVPWDSLFEVEKVGANVATNWLKQASPYSDSKLGRKDTIEIVGQIIVPPKIITFTGHGGYNIVLRDTSEATASGAWSSILVRTPTANDTVALYNAGFLSYVVGDIIRLRGYVSEFPTNNTVSATQFVPVAANFIETPTMSQCVEYIETKPVPPVPQLEVSQFMEGTFGAGTVKFTTGEQWEGCYIQLTDLIVVADVNSANGTVAMVDRDGNEISTMDGSKWFTLRGHKDPMSTFVKPTVGQVVDTIRGYIASNSGGEAARGYRIFPVFPGDIVLGEIYPTISNHRRTPVTVKSTDTVTVRVTAYTAGTSPIQSVKLYYSLNNASWESVLFTDSLVAGDKRNDSVYVAQIPAQPAGTFVKYFCEVQDEGGRKRILANAAGGTAWADTSQGFFFYTVKDDAYSIYDVQYTPFRNGTSGLIGGVVTIDGIVTADTSSLNIGSNGTSPWYIQSGNQPWSGIWVNGILDELYGLAIGDSVRVTGTVQEYLQGTSGSVGRVTRLGNVSSVQIIEHGKQVPSPVLLKTGDFAVINGALSAEPYEGMLVRFNNVTVTDVYPTYADMTEYTIDDGSGPVIVRSADGKNSYSPVAGDTLYGKTILNVGDHFSYVQGIIYFSFNQYKFVPRTDSDFGLYTPVSVGKVSNVVPRTYELHQNYPNPFNPTTSIEFAVPSAGKVTLKIYNILGQEITTLVNSIYTEGVYKVQFDGKYLPSGVYIYRLQTPEGAITKKMLLLK